MASVELTAELLKLQNAFAASLSEKILRLQELVGECCRHFAAGEIVPEEALRNAHLAAHSMAGSAGTFGLRALGESAKTLEELLAPLLDGKVIPDDVTVRRIMSVIAEIRTLGDARPDATVLAVASSEDTTAQRSQRTQRPVFLIGDNPVLAASLAAQLAHFGYLVQVFGSPRDVLICEPDVLPAAVVMDIGVSEGPLAGPKTMADALRVDLRGVPRFFISARDDFGARLEALRAGGAAYFTKPVDIDALASALEALPGQKTPVAYRVLIVEDSTSTAAFYQHVLDSAGMEAISIHDPSQIAGPLAEFAPDLILMDLYLPVCSGIELAALIRQQPGFVGIPIVFLSTETNTNRQLVALRQGGDDFLSKPIDPARLVSVVTSRAERGRILRARMANDGLTGLLNHSHLKGQLETEIARSRRQGKTLVFAMIDADHFKRVNDTWGHAAGDRVLRSLSKLLRQRLRRTDVAGRYGGEEFGVILTDVDARTALPLLDAIRRDFGALRQVCGDVEFSVSFSAGIAEFPHHNTAEALIAAADAAMYAAKQAGRDRIEVDSAD